MPRRLARLARCSLLAALCLAGCNPADPLAIDVSIIELTPGTGTMAVEGSTVTIHYVGKLDNGKVFDTTLKSVDDSLPADTPFTFTIGAETVIRGLERGVPGMRVGGKRRIIIPPELAFGNQAQGCPDECYGPDKENCDLCFIPANAQLTFDIDLLSVRLP